jgi:putative flippase GtrA
VPPQFRPRRRDIARGGVNLYDRAALQHRPRKEHRVNATTLRKFVLFGLAGGAGFVVDTAVLYLLKGALGLYGARVVSFLCAVATTWIINRSFAFKGQTADLPIWREFLHYLGAMILGGAVNYAVYAVLVATIPLVAEQPVLGVGAGVIAGMFVNFLLADRLVFKSRVPRQSV